METSPCPVNVLFDRPCIPTNTGATMRLSAVTGAAFHIAGPFGFELDDAQMARIDGLDANNRRGATPDTAEF